MEDPSCHEKMFLFFSVGFLAILGQGSYLNLPLFQETQMTASIVTQKNHPMPDENSISSSDYKEFFSGYSIPLSRMFGLGVKTIMIDAGHGGDDPGTIGKDGD